MSLSGNPNLPHPIMMKCLYLMLTRERGHWTWRNKYRPEMSKLLILKGEGMRKIETTEPILSGPFY